jgi:hypothetical protein
MLATRDTTSRQNVNKIAKNSKCAERNIYQHLAAFVFVPYVSDSREGIFKFLRFPGIDSKESIPSAYVDWRASSTTTLFLLDS